MTTISVSELVRLDAVPSVAWDTLTARPPASINGSRRWVAAAFALAHPAAVPLLLAATAKERLVALLPLALHEPDTAPTLRVAGSPHNDLSDVLHLPGHGRAAADAMLAALTDVRRRGWAVELDAIDPDGVLAAADEPRDRLRWSPGEPAPRVDLRSTWRSAASSRRRQQWNRRLRRLRERHHVEFRRGDKEEVLAGLADFVAMRAARLRATGRSDGLPPEPFLVDVVRRLAGTGSCAFMELLVDGRPAARDLYLLERPVATMWLRALDPSWRRYPCGHLLLRASAEAFAADGFDVLDLGTGDEPYKYVFGAERRVLLRACL